MNGDIFIGLCAVCGCDVVGLRDGMGNLLCETHKNELSDA